MGFVRFLAKLAYRTDNEPSGYVERVFALKFITGLAALGFLLTALGVGLLEEFKSWHDIDPIVSIPKSQWHFLPDDKTQASACDVNGAKKIQCVAAAENPALWQSLLNRSDADHDARVEKLRGHTYWLGARISAEQLKQAFSLDANHLVLGFISASYEVWIDGARYLKSNYTQNWLAAVVPLPAARLNEPHDMHVAVRVTHDLGAVYPDAMGIHIEEGLATTRRAENYVRRNLYEDSIRPWFFFGINLVLAGLFFVVWLANPKRQEYFYMSVYASMHAWTQSLASDLTTWDHFNIYGRHRLGSFSSVYTAAAALYVGLSFARARRSFFTLGIPLFIALPFVSLVFAKEARSIFFFNAWIETWIVPSCYFVAAFACVLQASVIKLRTRTGRLFLFAFGLTVIGMSYVIEASSLTSATEYVYWHRFMSLGEMVLLSGIMLREYKQQERLLERTPISPYHKRPVLPDVVTGVLLTIDLKNSEKLFRAGTSQGIGGALVQTALSHMWSAVIQSGGVVLRTEGDLLCAIFDTAETSDALNKCIKSTQLISENLQQFAEQLYDGGQAPRTTKLAFRAAICVGDIRPIWQEIQNTNYAAWIEAGPSNIFVESARLLELEREISTDSSSSIVVMPSALAKNVQLLGNAHWLLRDGKLTGKHEHIYEVSAFSTSVAQKMVSVAA